MLSIIESEDSTYMSYELVVYLYYAYACRVTENKIKNKEDIGRSGDHHFRR